MLSNRQLLHRMKSIIEEFETENPESLEVPAVIVSFGLDGPAFEWDGTDFVYKGKIYGVEFENEDEEDYQT